VGGDWTTPERFDRIEQMLAASPKHSRESLQTIPMHLPWCSTFGSTS
jgi:hypothetical protein